MLMNQQQQVEDAVGRLVERHGRDRSALIPVLQDLQAELGAIPDHAMQVLADALGLHPAEVHGVVTFYAFLQTGPRGRFQVRLCRTLSCDLAAVHRVARQLENELGITFGQVTPDGRFGLEWASCLGMCDQGPAMLVNERVYTRVSPEAVRAIIETCRSTFGAHAAQGGHAAPRDGAAGPAPSRRTELSFDSVAPGAGLAAALARSRADVIAEIAASGLRGRGGAGFPTGTKWNLAAAERAPEGGTKVVVCNADEGEPGTFKDRVLLAEYADLVLEGMTIGARAIGATRGIVYLRGEYAYLRPHLEEVLARRRAAGLLGAGIAGHEGFDFDIEIRMGAGAYVCGEETALIESLEGNRGEPRNRPPFPVNTGFQGQPTVVNNVETLASVTAILARGAAWFRAVGSERSAGFKMFSVSGDCERPGVYEFPLGLTVAELLEQVGGRGAKAVQIGGASGTCVPAAEFGRRIAFEDLSTGGSVIVLGPGRDMLHVARNFMEFFVDESCGQCTPCRIGNARLLEGIERLEAGTCSSKYLHELVALGETMRLASKCGLGQSSPNAFVSIVEGFRDEVLGRTPATAGGER